MKLKMKKICKVFLPTVLGLFLFSSVASAHVTVAPTNSTTGAWETYTLKVPTEKTVPTTKVTVKVPSGLTIEQYQPVPGWNYSTQKDSSGNVTSFTFEATGEGIQPGQFQQFVFVAKNPAQATKAAWDAYQYYKDGSIVEWTGDEGAKTPHSITSIVSATSVTPNKQASTAKTQTKVTQVTAAPAKTSSTPLVLSIIAVLLSLVSVVFAVRKK
jgi:uncharacterized protein YcnI